MSKPKKNRSQESEKEPEPQQRDLFDQEVIHPKYREPSVKSLLRNERIGNLKPALPAWLKSD